MENEQTAVATPVVESVVAEPQTVTSTEPQAETKVPAEGQPTNTGPVEPVVQSPVSQEETRPKPQASEFYKQRQKVKALEKQLADLQKAVEASRTQPASPSDKKPERNLEKEFYEKPFPTVLELIENVVNQRITTSKAEQEFESKWQMGLNTIRNSEYFKADGDVATERFQTIIRENGLDEMAQKDPIKAANLAIKLYASEYPRAKPVEKSPLAPPSKGRMVSTQTGTPSAPKEVKVDDLMNELKKMKETVAADPSKLNDPAYKQRVQEIRTKLAEIQK